jgi:U3 small nucleolar RNA-associated protein 13
VLQVLSTGADGLLKLWDTRTGTDLATFESHDNRLWGLAVSAGVDESLLASGGDDSRVVVWRDVTADKAAAAEAEEEELVLKQQELSNALTVSLGIAVANVFDTALRCVFCDS